MEKYDNLTKFQTNINFIKECLIISLREIVEYKITFYSSFFVSIFTALTIILSLLVFKDNFYFLNLDINIILFYVLFSETISCLFLMFFKGRSKSIFYTLVRGNFNNFLTKPTNILLHFIFNGIKVRWFINSLFYFLILLVFLKVQDLSFSKFFFIFFLSLIIGYLFIALTYLIDSLSFFCNVFPFLDFFISSNVNIRKFPPTFFDKFEYKNFLYLLPLSLFVFPTLYFFNIITLNYFLMVLFIVLFLSIILTFLIILVWRKGLKSYSAFG